MLKNSHDILELMASSVGLACLTAIVHLIRSITQLSTEMRAIHMSMDSMRKQVSRLYEKTDEISDRVSFVEGSSEKVRKKR